MPLSSDQINSIINGQNQSSGGWGAAAMPTMAMPQGVGSNAIPTGAIPGRTAEGLLGARNNPGGYIQGLLSQHNPGNWQGGLADMLSRSVPQSTPLLDQRRGGNPAIPTTGAPAAAAPAATAPAFDPRNASDGPFARPAPDGAGPGDGSFWNMTNGGVITGYRRDYSPVFGPPGSTPSQAFV